MPPGAWTDTSKISFSAVRIALKSRVLNQMKSGIEYNEMVPRCWVTRTSRASITSKGSWPGWCHAQAESVRGSSSARQAARQN